MRVCGFLILILLYAQQAYGRFYGEDINLETWLQQQGNDDRVELDQTLTESFNSLAQNPIDINTATVEQFYELPDVSWRLASAIVAYRAEHGPFNSVGALSQVEGMASSLLALIRPFIRVSQPRQAMVGKLRYRRLSMQGVGRDTTVLEQNAEAQDYLRWNLRRNKQQRAGGLLTRRLRSRVSYDPASGSLRSPGPELSPALENLYYITGDERRSFIIGNYSVGFAERLTFDVSQRRFPQGLAVENTVSEYPVDARLRPTRTLFGIAASWRRPGSRGELNPTVFVSSRSRDSYQYDLRYSPDASMATVLGPCQRADASSQGFTCGEDGRWYSSQILATDDQQARLSYQTLQDAIIEQLAGFNLSWQSVDGQSLGLTAYRSRMSIAIDAPQIRFAPAARYPNRASLYAMGLHYSWRNSQWLVSSEFTTTQQKGLAWFGRITRQKIRSLQWKLALRYYGPDYVNPFARGSAAADEVLGLSQRNERGINLQVAYRPRTLYLISEIDVWDNPYRYRQDPQGLVWQKQSAPAINLKFYQRLQKRLSQHESVKLSLGYINKDIGHNGRQESYLETASDARGERRKLRLKLSTSRLRSSTALLEYYLGWKDVARYNERFEREQSYRAYFKTRLGHRLVLDGMWRSWRHLLSVSEDDPVDREQPRWQLRFKLVAKLFRALQLRLSYSRYRYQDQRLTRYERYQGWLMGVDYSMN